MSADAEPHWRKIYQQWEEQWKIMGNDFQKFLIPTYPAARILPAPALGICSTCPEAPGIP